MNRLIGLFTAEGATHHGVKAYRPAWSSCIATSPPASCTASVTTRWVRAARRVVSIEAIGYSWPSTFGE